VRGYELRLPGTGRPLRPGASSLQFTLDAKSLAGDLGNTLTTIVQSPPADVHQTTTIVVRRGRAQSTPGTCWTVCRTHAPSAEAYDTLSADYPTTSAVPDDVAMAHADGQPYRISPRDGPS